MADDREELMMADTLRVLYVDDERDLLTIGKLFLEKGGDFAVDMLSSAEMALEHLNTEQYDAIISDYQMPGMDGITFLKHLKASGNTTPFIIFTGRGREEVVIEALNSGADFYLQKGGEPKAQFTELAYKIQSAVRRQRTEKLAKDTERRLYDIINFLPDATFAIDKEGRVIAWNRAIEEMTGVPARDMVGKGNYEYSVPFYGEHRPILIDLVSIADEELTRGKYVIIKKEGDILIAETTLPRPLGRYSVLLGKASPLYSGNGDVIGAIESIRDITEQKRAEEALSESGRQLNAMATNIPGVVYRFYVNPDGTFGFDYISERSRQVLGLENDPATFFDRVTMGIVPEDRERFLISVQLAISTKTLWEFTSWYMKPSGKKIWFSAVSSPVMENDRLIFDGVIFDNTARKRDEVELLKKNEELIASYEQIAAADEELLSNFNKLSHQEHALRESGFFLEETQRIARLGGWKANPHTDYLEWTDGLYDIIEAPRDYHPGLNEGMKYFTPEDIPVIREKVANCLATGEPFTMEVRITTETGKKVWAELRGLAPVVEGARSYVMGTLQDITESKQNGDQIVGLSELKEKLLEKRDLGEQLRLVSESCITIFGADFARIWLIKDADLCEKGCRHAAVTSGPEVCYNRSQCLHLVVSSGRYTHIDGGHQRVPFGCYKIGRVASGEDPFFITNDVVHDPRVHDPTWAQSLGLASFAGFRLLSQEKKPIGVLALFRDRAILQREEKLLVDLANTLSQVIISGIAEEEIRVKNEELRASYEQIAATEEELRANLDKTVRHEQALRKSEEKLRMKLDSVLSPDDDLAEQDLANIIDTESIQSLMDDFHAVTGMPIGIVDLEGNVLVKVGWQEICTKFHRVHPETQKNCIESNLALSSGVAKGEFRAYRCRNNMWDIVTPIFIGDKHVGNLFCGQFFYDDEVPDHQVFIIQAEKYGFDKDRYLAALDAVPRWSREKVISTMHFYAKFAELVSKISYSNLNLAKMISAQKLVETALTDSETQSRMLLSQLPDIVMVQRDGLIVYVNQTAVEMTGYNREELIGSHLFDYVIPEYREIIVRNMARRAAGEPVDDYEVDLLDRSGAVHHVIARTNPIVFNKVPSVLTILIDITGRRQVEEELRFSERKFAAAFDASPDPIAITDLKTSAILDTNHAFEEWSGYMREEMSGKTTSELNFWAHPEERDVFIRILNAEGAAYKKEVTFRKKNGDPRNILFSAKEVRIGDQDCMLSVAEDITERKRAEEALRESELKYRSLIESSSDAIFCVDQNGEYKFTNLIFASTFDKTPDYFIGKTFWDIYPKEHADYRQRTNLAVFETGVTQAIEVEVPLPDKTLYFIAKANPIKDETGKVILNLTHATDITERKRAEDALHEANKKLNLLSSITRHDINNQLTVLQGSLSLLEDTPLDPSQNEYYQMASTAAQHISAMIQFTKEYESIGVKAPAWLEVRPLVHLAAKEAPLGNVTVNNDLPAGLEIFGDQLIGKVFYNLMDNAVRYGGKISTVRFSVQESYDDTIIVCEDDGVGVPAGEKEQVFEPGFGKNTGLGLALSREILDITGITIREMGEPGKGARFEMTVPKGAWRMV